MSRPNKFPECPVQHPDCVWLAELVEQRVMVERLTLQVRTDELTGLYNYRHLMECLAQELERSERSGQPTALVMLDLDHFKRVNDSWGHENGNRVLMHTADLIRAAIRRIDVPCRYGGEELVLILPGTQLGHAVRVARRLHRMIIDSPVEVAEGSIAFTASMGVDVYLPGEKLTPETFIERADRLLYSAKQTGRNRVVARELAAPTRVSQDERDALLGEGPGAPLADSGRKPAK